ncbi:MAG TPA: MBL fold metallo-hydrolase [Flavobacterium sp.]|jgi:glyoxylase-like metal-dependent hydrolase (beta-lactamase superfamily II)
MDTNMHQSQDNHIIPMTSVSAGKGREVAPDVFYYTNQIVNLVLVGAPGSGSWVLIDAGMPESGKAIHAVAEERFGKGVAPKAIILTHGHFDHVGSIVHLLEVWPGVPVYAHPIEFPFLTGLQAYPEPDPTVQGGMLAKISKIYPHEPIDITPVLQPLPPDGTVPELFGWKWIATPGHTPGHVSFFRDSDKLLIAGDAFVTVKQDSMYKVLIQKEEVHGPPPYLTTDWTSARDSVRKLEALQPEIAITGHGSHMSGAELQQGLSRLATDFDVLALPDYGKYVRDSDKE